MFRPVWSGTCEKAPTGIPAGPNFGLPTTTPRFACVCDRRVLQSGNAERILLSTAHQTQHTWQAVHFTDTAGGSVVQPWPASVATNADSILRKTVPVRWTWTGGKSTTSAAL